MMTPRYFLQPIMSSTGSIYVAESKGRGRGVFSRKTIEQDQTIEICPVLVIPAIHTDRVRSSGLVDYFFNFNKEENTIAFALGFGSLYNHAVYSNAAYDLDKENKTLRFYALEEIKPGREITINYGGERGVIFTEWFTSRNIQIT